MFLWCTTSQATKVGREEKNPVPSATRTFSELGCSGWWGVNDMSICPVGCEDLSFSLSLCCAPGGVKEGSSCKTPSLTLLCLTGIFGIITCSFIHFSSKGYSSLHFIYSTAFSEGSELLELKPSLISVAFHLVSQSLKCFSPVKISEI